VLIIEVCYQGNRSDAICQDERERNREREREGVERK
jgi:hypothetical protein